MAREMSAMPFASITGAPPSSTTLVLPTKAITWPASFSVSLRLVAVWKRSSAVTSVSLRPHTPPLVVDHVEVGLHAVHAGLAEAGHQAR